MGLAPGTMVTDKVRLKSPLEEGAMGTVWVADHLGFNAEVAVKFILPELQASNPQALARFNLEAKALGQIKSQHVVQIFDRSEMPDGTPFIVMEKLEGETLVERLERAGAIPPELLAKILRQLADALHEVHRHGFVHRDMKAENIFLSGPETSPFVKLLDFGVCKLPVEGNKAKLTTPGMLVGTPEYMSPTQTVAAMAVDHKADLWALAVLTYLSLTLQFPFVGENTREVFAAIRAGQFTPVSYLRPDLGTVFDPLFTQAFLADPKQRYESAADIAQAFELTLLGMQLAAAGATPGDPAVVKTQSQTKWLIVGLIGAGLVIIFLLLIILLKG